MQPCLSYDQFQDFIVKFYGAADHDFVTKLFSAFDDGKTVDSRAHHGSAVHHDSDVALVVGSQWCR